MPDEVMPSLDAFARRANEEHIRAESAAREFVEHAYACGVALLQAHELVPRGEWSDWRTRNLTFSDTTARLYMRTAAHYGALQDADAHTYPEVRAALAGLPPLPRKFSDRTNVAFREALNARHDAGETWKQLAETFGVNINTIRYWANPDYAAQARRIAKRNHAKRARRNREAKAALERSERERFARSAGDGDLGKAYSETRRALVHLDGALSVAISQDEREHVRLAMSRLHAAEEEIVRALRVQRGEGA